MQQNLGYCCRQNILYTENRKPKSLSFVDFFSVIWFINTLNYY